MKDRGVAVIGAFKLVKALVLVAAGLGALNLLHGGQARELVEWAHLAPASRILQKAGARVSGLSERQLEAAAVATFAYAAIFLVEGVGLIARKRWAEWLTVIVTASFIPLEIYELAKSGGAGKILALAINVGIVVYLAVRLRKRR
jgi:uncharacterized membrane protein (DUF2068 family)